MIKSCLKAGIIAFLVIKAGQSVHRRMKRIKPAPVQAHALSVIPALYLIAHPAKAVDLWVFQKSLGVAWHILNKYIRS